MEELLFPEEAIVILRAAVYFADAKRSYDMMSGSFLWSDELLRESAPACRRHNSWAFRYLLGYRGSVIRGTPDNKLLPVWEQVMRSCPNWPGFRPERNSTNLAAELRRIGKAECRRIFAR
jgi:hypothetical protein